VTLLVCAGDLTNVGTAAAPRGTQPRQARRPRPVSRRRALWWALGAHTAMETAQAGCGSRDLPGCLSSAHSVGCTHAWFGYLFIGLFSVTALLDHRAVLR
jgi:hypothetical protein